MTKNVIVPLESARLIEYAVPISCYICDTDNTFDAEFCTHCLAPMALAHQANSQKSCPQMIAVVGAAAAGKTVYLGMLMDMPLLVLLQFQEQALPMPADELVDGLLAQTQALG